MPRSRPLPPLPPASCSSASLHCGASRHDRTVEAACVSVLIIAALAAFTLLVGVPIAYVILLACFLIIANDPFVSLGAVPAIFVQGMDLFILLSIPLFVLV